MSNKKISLIIVSVAVVIIACIVLVVCLKDWNNTIESLTKNGITVEGGSFSKGCELSATTVGKAETVAEVITALAMQEYDKTAKHYVYDIYVVKDGTKVQPNGNVKITLPAPNESVNNYLIFHIRDDNVVEKLVATCNNGTIAFETSSFSFFAVVEAVEGLDSSREGVEAAIAEFIGMNSFSFGDNCLIAEFSNARVGELEGGVYYAVDVVFLAGKTLAEVGASLSMVDFVGSYGEGMYFWMRTSDTIGISLEQINGIFTLTLTKDSTLAEGEIAVYCDTVRGTVSGGGMYRIGDTVTLTATAKEGYTFECWYDGNGNEVSKLSVYTFVVTIENDGTYYASFAIPLPLYKVTLDVNGGDPLDETELLIEEGADRPLPTPSREGFIFYGWKTKYNDVLVQSTDKFRDSYASIYSDCKLYATWLPTRCATIDADRWSISAIYTQEEFAKIGEQSRGLKCVLLEADIDLMGVEWIPQVFYGVIAGNNHKVKNVTIDYSNYFADNPNQTSTVFCGLFDTFNGYANDLIIEGVTIKTPIKDENRSYPYVYCGGFAGRILSWGTNLTGVYDENGERVNYADTELHKCSVSNFVIDGNTGDWCGAFAGVVARSSTGKGKSIIEGCHTDGSLSLTINSFGVRSCFGGLVGNLNYQGIVRNCYSTVNVTAEYIKMTVNGGSGSGYVGGLIGCTYGSLVENSYSTGIITVKAEGDCFIGGLIAYVGAYSSESWIKFGSTVRNCYYMGELYSYVISDQTELRYAFKGGIAGTMYAGTISNCWADAKTWGQTLGATPENVSSYSGGILGGTTDNSYSTGTIKDCFSVQPNCFGNSNNISTPQKSSNYAVENVGVYGEFEKEKVFGEYHFGEFVSIDDTKKNSENVWIIENGSMKLYWQ
ncbi:MAG: InlB B-repeat-containing protein [Clostridia bacterium]|nr:InlB B-repeat-containing protein [Clostridia bacterium]